MKLQIKQLENSANIELPYYATSSSAGMDLHAANAESVVIAPGETALIPTGLAIALPSGYEAQVRPRSGLALKHSVTVLNTPGTIDADYRGEVGVILINHGKKEFVVERNMRVAQMVIAQYEQAEIKLCTELDDTVRGERGFGSTGTASAA